MRSKRNTKKDRIQHQDLQTQRTEQTHRLDLLEKKVEQQLVDVSHNLQIVLDGIKKISSWIKIKFGTDLLNSEQFDHPDLNEIVLDSTTHNVPNNSVVPKDEFEEVKMEVEALEVKIKDDEENAVSEVDLNISNAFTTNEDDKIHEETKHKKPKQASELPKKAFSCPICNVHFTLKSSLVRHQKETHAVTVEQIHSCDWPNCTRTFQLSSRLTHHKRTHTRKPTLNCEYCGKLFRLTEKLQDHIRTHTGEKPFGCTYCDKKFRRRDVLKKHILVHTGEKRFLCHYCERTFTRQDHLKTHLTIHTGVQPYKCKVCGKQYRRNDSFYHHKQTHLKNQVKEVRSKVK